MIPFSDPKASYLARRAEIDAAIARVLQSGTYILGEEVHVFEEAFAAHVGVQRGVGVASGTDAIHLALRALRIGAGDEVITVSHTAVATVHAVALSGATSVLVDVGEDLTIAPERVEAAITPRTKALLPVHLYGQPCHMEPLVEIARRRGLAVVEDASQAHGARIGSRRVGSFGDAACFSFYPTKNLGAFGDGGMVVTDDANLADRIQALREYGWDGDRTSQQLGINSRLDELHAAVLRVKLNHLDEDNALRHRVARSYHEALKGTSLVLPAERSGTTHAYHLYVVRSPERDALRSHLLANGIAPGIHYPLPTHLHPGLQSVIRTEGPLTTTERAAREVLSLPIYSELRVEQVNEVISNLLRFRGGLTWPAARAHSP